MRIPLHLDPKDQSPETDAKRYDLHAAMYAMRGGRGFRTVGGKRGVTKRHVHNRITSMSANAYSAVEA